MEHFKNTVSIEDFYKSDMTLISLPNDEPLFKLIQKNNKLYTMFLLQDRTLVKKKHLLYITEILITEPNVTDLYNLIDSKITIVEFLSKSKNFKLGKLNDLTFPITELKDLSIIQKKLSQHETCLQLDEQLKNKRDDKKHMTNYEKYQLQWLIDHNHSLTELIQELEDYINQDSPDIKINLSKAFEEWEFNIGFNSEIYACEEEFNDAEAYYDL